MDGGDRLNMAAILAGRTAAAAIITGTSMNGFP
jgi:hypothetical protein